MPRRRLVLPSLAAVVLAASLAAPGAAGPAADTVGLGTIDPPSGPPGTTISYTVVGGPNADSECRGSSAFATELLDASGARIATGADTIAVPDGASEGAGFLRLICYIADGTGRRVIRGVCTGFEITAPGGASAAGNTPEGATINEPCPATPRMVASQSVIDAQERLGLTFNQVLAGLGAG